MLSKSHHVLLKKKNNLSQTRRQQTKLKDGCASTARGQAVVKRIQNYVAHNVAARSMPFTAGEMALDCVSAALCSVAGPNFLNPLAIEVLTKAGLTNEAAAFHRLQYVSGSRKAEGPSGGRKRRRVQLRRGAIQKRIKILGQEVQELKREFLAKCPYITLIIDEGNNWSKTCPLYVAVLACSAKFECRIMFIGQVSSFVLDFYYDDNN